MTGARRLPSEETVERIRTRIDQAFAGSDERTYREERRGDEGEHVFVVDDVPERRKIESIVGEHDVEYEADGTEVRVFVRDG